MLSLTKPLEPRGYFFTNKQLYALMLPLVAEQLLSIMVGLADSIMVSTAGDAAISAVSLVDAISVLMIFVFSAMATGGAAVASQYIGRGERSSACRAGQQLMVLLGVVSTAVTLLLYALKTPILNGLFSTVDPEVMEATDTYYSIVMAAIPGIALYNGGAALFRTMERTDVSLKVSLLMNVINIGGNSLLIFGFRMGVAGVAIPTLVSRYVAAFIVVAMLFNKKYALHLSDIRSFRLEPRVMKNILYIGIPSGVENGMFQLGKLVLNSLVSTFGTAAIAANAIGNTLGVLHCCAGIAVNLGLMTVVGQCVGAGDYDQARYYFRKIFIATAIAQIAVNGLLILLLRPTMLIYSVSPEAQALAVKIALLHGISAAFLWLPAFQLPTALRAAGDASFTMLVSMCSMWLCRVLFAYVLSRNLGWGVYGVWFAQSILDWSVRTVIFVWRYFSGKWMTKAIKS